MSEKQPLKMDLQFFAEKEGGEGNEPGGNNQLMDTVKEMKKELDNYRAEEKARKRLKEQEDLANQKAEQVAEREKKERELQDEFFEKMFQEKLNQKRREKKVEFPVGLRQGNLKRTDKELLDIVQGRKTLKVPNYKTVITAGGSGAEWVPTELAQEIVRDVQELVTARNFLRVIDMPSNPYEVPLRTGRAQTFYGGEAQTIAENNNDFMGKMRLVAAKLGAYVPVSTEEEEDAIIPVLPEIRAAIAEGIADDEEIAIYQGKHTQPDGSTVNISEFDGLLAVAGVTETFGTDDDSATGSTDESKPYSDGAKFISSLRGKMGKYGVRPQDLAVSVPIEVYTNVLIDDPALRTVDKYGPNATILTGEVGKVYGISVFVSSGLQGAAGNKLTSYPVTLTNRRIPRMGDRRQLTIKTDEQVKTDTVDVVGTQRVSLGMPDSNDGTMRNAVAHGEIWL